MIIAHLADLHLGFSAYEGWIDVRNAREADVEAAFLAAVDELGRIRPDVVLIAGDVFDRPHPPSSALVVFARGLELLRARLPDAPVLVAAGARDVRCRGDDPGVLAVLDTLPGVEAAADATRSVRIRGGALHVCLLPHRSALSNDRAGPTPDPAARWNVLVTHALDGTLRYPGDGRGGTSPRELTIDPTRWDYVALGGEHVQRSVRPNVRWAGSLERIGGRPWDEALEEKGFLTYDLATRRSTFHPVAVRAVVSLAPIRVPPGEPDRLERRVREVVDEVPGGIEGKIVLVRIQGAAPPDLRGLAEDLLPALRQRALHLSVVLEESGRSAAGRRGDDLRARLAGLLQEEGVQPEEAVSRAGALLAESVVEPTPR